MFGIWELSLAKAGLSLGWERAELRPGASKGIFRTCSVLFHGKTGIEEREKGDFGFQDGVECEE